MSRYLLVAIFAYTLGSNFWAYPTVDGVTFGLGQWGWFYEWSEYDG